MGTPDGQHQRAGTRGQQWFMLRTAHVSWNLAMLCRGQRLPETATQVLGRACGVTQVTGQSPRQRHMQGCQGLQLAHLQLRTTISVPHLGTGAAGDGSFESCWTCSPGAPPHTGKVQLGAGFRAQGPPARIVFDGTMGLPQLPARNLQAPTQVCVAGSFPRTVPCLSRGAKFIRGSQPPELQLPKLARLQ